MNKHIIYIPNLGQEYLLSQQLAHAFAKHNYDSNGGTSPIIIAQYGSNLKPLELVTPTDILQIMFTPISDLYAPMHNQVNNQQLLEQIPMLINHLLQDGLHPNGCTIQLYTLEHNDQSTIILREIANELIKKTKFINFSLEWHIIPKLKNLTHEQLNKIFEPQVTCRATIHAITKLNNEIELKEFSGIYIRSDNFH
jgi:hypothetical protein